MFIYHGTNTKFLSKILKKGISPRGYTGKTNWENAPSHPEMVYLSSAYPFYFSYFSKSERKYNAVVFEIDFEKLNKELLYPDEDFIYHVLRNKKNGLINREITLEEIRENLFAYKDNWKLSLDNMGNLCYRGIIYPSMITRYCVVDFSKNSVMAMRVLDPSISPLNFRLCGNDYQDMVKWFFGDIDYLPDVQQNRLFLDSDQEHLGEDMKKMYKQKIDFWKKISENRKGIEVFSLNESVKNEK